MRPIPPGKQTLDPFRVPVTVTLNLEEEQVEGLLLDLSIHGIGVLLRRTVDWEPNCPMVASFVLPGQRVPFQMPVVALNGELAPGGFRVGLEIREEDALRATRIESALASYLSERQRRDLSNRAV